MNDSSISRRVFLKGVASTGFVLSTISCSPGLQSPGSKPNIILILADDLGYECLGANGGTSYQTPILDKLAREGMRFEHCYAQPLCTPSRVQIMTGIYNICNYSKFDILNRDQMTFAHFFKKAGYKTCIVGKWQLGKEQDSPQHFGFDESCLWQHMRRPSRYVNPGLEINGVRKDFRNGEYGPDLVSDYACGFMERNRSKPFLLYYPMILTHSPFEPVPNTPDWNPHSKGSETYEGNPKYFPDMVTYMDKMVGNIIKKLDALGLRENTLILFTGDNGTAPSIVSQMGERMVRGGKSETTDAGTHVPFIANWPGVISRGQVCRDLIDFTDFLPTMCDAAGIRTPDRLDGKTFWPQLKGEQGTARRWVYCWYSRSGEVEKAREFARDHRYKLYRTGEFYDLEKDPLEIKDIAANELNPEAVEAKKMLHRVLENYQHARPSELLEKRPKK